MTTEKEIIENNKLIARFLGYKTYKELQALPKEDKYLSNWFFIYDEPNGNYAQEPESLKYHRDWNSLMKAVEKLENLGYGFHVSPSHIEVIDYTTGNEETIVSFDFDFDVKKIEQFHYTVVELVKWYNKKTKND